MGMIKHRPVLWNKGDGSYTGTMFSSEDDLKFSSKEAWLAARPVIGSGLHRDEIYKGQLDMWERAGEKFSSKKGGLDGFEGADPFASQRAGYQEQLKTGMTSGDPYGGWGTKMQELMNGQFDATDPSYKWRYEQGLQATQRAGAAKGLGASGNEMLALQEAGQGMASQEYGNQFNRLFSLMGQSARQFNATMDRLANLSGAQFSPAAPYQLGVQKYGIDVGAQTSLQTARIGASASTANAAMAAQTSRANAAGQLALGYAQLNSQNARLAAADQGAAAAIQNYQQRGNSGGTASYYTTTAPIMSGYSPGQSGQGSGYVQSSSGTTSFYGSGSSYSPFVNQSTPAMGNIYDTEVY